MSKTTKIVSASAMVLILVASAVAVKIIFFPSVSDKYFQMTPARLRQVPSGLVVVRPTHFPDSARGSSPSGMMQIRVKDAMWMVGRNISFQQLMATAYQYSQGRIALPPDAPKDHYDLLVTVAKNPEARLQSAIRRKFGYVAQRETRDTEVLVLTVEDPNPPGLKVSTATKGSIAPKNNRLYFTHMQLNVVTDGLEQMLKLPVVDKTGLTNYYDFSLAWDRQTQQQIQGARWTKKPAEKSSPNGGWDLNRTQHRLKCSS